MPDDLSRYSAGNVGQAVVVLGAGGFVGGAIVRGLAAGQAWRPVAAMRRPGPLPSGVSLRLADARDPIAVGRAVEGAAFAVNAVLGDAPTMLTVTRNLCEAARAHGLRRIVHISTMSVYGAATGVIGEDASLAADGSAYAEAKIGCEAIVRAFVAQGGDAVILRPGIVYGPGGEQWVGRIARLLRAGRLGDLGALGDGLCNLIHCDDLAGAVAAACETDAAGGLAFNLAEPEPPCWNQYFMALARAIGAVPVRRVTPRRMRLETKLLAPPLQIAKLVGQRAGLCAGTLPEPIPPSLLALWQQRIRLDHRRADAVLDFARTPWPEGVAQSAAWFRGAAAMAAPGVATDAAA